jgi:hypothetical protein
MLPFHADITHTTAYAHTHAQLQEIVCEMFDNVGSYTIVGR